jgi:glycosyltransferase involved in cell wall biosynthesis
MTQVSVEQNVMPEATLFIAWIAYSRRSQLIADKLGIKLHTIQSLKRHYIYVPLRYVLQAVRTFAILLRERPRLIFVQNPPIFAAMVVYVYARMFDARYVIDSHTGALLAPWWKWSLPIHAFLSRRAIATIVTNQHLKALVESWGARSFIIADIPTTFPVGKPFPLNGKFNVAVINSFSPDEPLEEILEAAAALPEVQFYVTGDLIRAKDKFFRNQLDNVTFTGFLPDEEYFGLLRGAQAVMTLTTDDHTMQRAACEAVSLGKPIITSNWLILREYFNRGTIHVDNTARGIREAVIRMQERREALEDEVLMLQRERWQEWQHKHAALVQLIGESLKDVGST